MIHERLREEGRFHGRGEHAVPMRAQEPDLPVQAIGEMHPQREFADDFDLDDLPMHGFCLASHGIQPSGDSCGGLSVLYPQLPVTQFAAAVCNGHDVNEVAIHRIDNRERESPEHEMTQVIVKARAEIGMSSSNPTTRWISSTKRWPRPGISDS